MMLPSCHGMVIEGHDFQEEQTLFMKQTNYSSEQLALKFRALGTRMLQCLNRNLSEHFFLIRFLKLKTLAFSKASMYHLRVQPCRIISFSSFRLYLNKTSEGKKMLSLNLEGKAKNFKEEPQEVLKCVEVYNSK